MRKTNFKTDLKKRRPVTDLRKKFGKPEAKSELITRLRAEKATKNEIVHLEDAVKNRNKNKFGFSYYTRTKGSEKLCFEELRKILKSIDAEIMRYEKKLQSCMLPSVESKHIVFDTRDEDSESIFESQDEDCTTTTTSDADSCITLDSDDTEIIESSDFTEVEEEKDSLESEHNSTNDNSTQNSDSFSDSDISEHYDFENKENTIDSMKDKVKQAQKQRNIYEQYLRELVQKRQIVMDKILKIIHK